MKYDYPKPNFKLQNPYAGMTYDERRAAFYNSTYGDMTECNICKGRGDFDVTLNGKEAGAVLCKCMEYRNRDIQLEKSNAKHAVQTFTMDSFKTKYEWQKKMKSAALKSLREKKWFALVGKSGAGKTHLCSALLSEWSAKGADVELLSWRQEANTLKRHIMDIEYESTLRHYREVDVLLIDDLLKSVNPSDADIQLAMEIIDTRYAQDRITIINTEWSMADLIKFESSLGTRISEKAELVHAKNATNIRIEKKKGMV